MTSQNDAYATALLPFNSATVQVPFPDVAMGQAGHSWKPRGSAVISTTQSKFGGASAYFDGTTNCGVTAEPGPDFDVGHNEFSIDGFFYVSGGNGGSRFICGQSNSGAGGGFAYMLNLTSANKLRFAVSTDGSTLAAQVLSTSTFTAAGWHYVCARRTADNKLQLFIDNVQEGGDVSFSGTVFKSPNAFGVGCFGEYGGMAWNGYLDLFRLSIGVARAASAPTAPWDIELPAWRVPNASGPDRMSPGSFAITNDGTDNQIVLRPGDSGNIVTLWSELQQSWIDYVIPTDGIVFDFDDCLVDGKPGAMPDGPPHFVYAKLDPDTDEPVMDVLPAGLWRAYYGPGALGFTVDAGFGALPGSFKRTLLGMAVRRTTVQGDGSTEFVASWPSQGLVGLICSFQSASGIAGDNNWHALTPQSRKLGFLLWPKIAASVHVELSITHNTIGANLQIRVSVKYVGGDGAGIASAPATVDPLFTKTRQWTVPNTGMNTYGFGLSFEDYGDGFYEFSVDVKSNTGTINSDATSEIRADGVPF